MKINLKNKELDPALRFLQGLELPAKESRHRSKLVTLLIAPLEELQREERALAKQFDLLDERGMLKKEEECDSGSVVAFNIEQGILLEEEVVISAGLYAQNLKAIPAILNAYDGLLAGEEAIIYNRLLDEFEESEVIKNDE